MSDILIAGDVCEDVYLFSTNKKANSENDAPLYTIDRIQKHLGMAYNVYNNCSNMNDSVHITYNGDSLSQKTRFFYNDKYILRIDEDKISIDNSTSALVEYMKNARSLIISDYGKGFWNKEKFELVDAFEGPVFIDPYTDKKLSDYPLCTAIVPNLKEGSFLTGETNPEEICKALYGNVHCQYAILKLGADGALLMKKGFDKPQHFPGEKVNVVDTCGAGDSFIAALTTAYCVLGKSIEESIKLANKAAAITVKHQGVYAITKEEWQTLLQK